MSAPRIAVSGLVREWQEQPRTGVNAAYIRAVLAAGGMPLIVSPLIGQSRAADLVDGVDGLLLTGGEDVDPALYREAPSPRLDAVDRERDLFEIALFAEAWRREVPVLAVCRGLQLVNVALGGTLWQDLPSERPGTVAHATRSPRSERTHAVSVRSGSRLGDAVGGAHIDVNSFHHQAVKELAQGLMATAWADDGLIEGVESAAEDPWLLAVQWHPEEMHADRSAPDAGLFTALVRKALSARERDTARSLR